MQLQKIMTLVWKVQRVLWEFRTRTTSIAQGIQGALLSGRGQDGVRSHSQLDNMKRAFQGGESSGQSSKNSQSVKALRISPHYPTTVWGVFADGVGVCSHGDSKSRRWRNRKWERGVRSWFQRPFPLPQALPSPLLLVFLTSFRSAMGAWTKSGKSFHSDSIFAVN